MSSWAQGFYTIAENRKIKSGQNKIITKSKNGHFGSIWALPRRVEISFRPQIHVNKDAEEWKLMARWEDTEWLKPGEASWWGRGDNLLWTRNTFGGLVKPTESFLEQCLKVFLNKIYRIKWEPSTEKCSFIHEPINGAWTPSEPFLLGV